MKKIIFSLICFCTCLPLVAIANYSDYDVLFVNNSTQEFTALVSQSVKCTGLVRFADAEIPPDPNPPVVRSAGNGCELTGLNSLGNSDVYSLELDGPDSFQFSASIMWRSLTSNECTVLVTYHPLSLGTHSATLRVHCANAGVPTVKVNLQGEATGVLGDLDGDGLISIRDVTSMINMLLVGAKGFQTADVNDDGQFTISDVTTLINRLLTDQ